MLCTCPRAVIRLTRITCTCGMRMMCNFHSLVACQGDDFAAGLAEGEKSMVNGEKLGVLRLVGCSLGDEGVCRLAKALEAVGECRVGWGGGTAGNGCVRP